MEKQCIIGTILYKKRYMIDFLGKKCWGRGLYPLSEVQPLAYMGLPLVLGTYEGHVCEDLIVGRTLLARWGCKSRFSVCIAAFCK